MAEEQTNETQSGQGAESAESQNENTETTQTPEVTEDWESKYKALQGEHQKKAEELDRVRETFDLVTPYVDWSKLQEQPESSGGDERQEVTREDLTRILGTVENKLLIADFRNAHPDLREYEDTLVSSFVGRLRRSNPRMSQSELLEKAAEQTREFLKMERAKGKAEATKTKAEAASTAGMGSVGTTSSAKKKGAEETEGESTSEYLARRKKESAKARGLVF